MIRSQHSMMNYDLKVLLVDDDEDDYIIFKDVLSQIKHMKIQLDWRDGFDAGLDGGKCNEHDIYFIDFRLDRKNGLELMEELIASGCDKPIIILTGRGDHYVDVEAMRLGAADYLEKDAVSPANLERTIRYAINRWEILSQLRISERKLRSLSAQLIDTQETERKAIAQELHDSVSASLTAIKFGLEKTLLDKSENILNHTETLEALIELVHSTIDEIQNICANLRPAIIDELGIAPAVHWLARQHRETYPDIQLDYKCEISEDNLPSSIKIAMFRILQEAMHNAMKHSEADYISVSLSEDENNIMVSLEDNGKGFDLHAERLREGFRTGMGLLNMKERAELSGGTFEIQSLPGQGTRVKSRWPKSVSTAT